MKDLLKKFSMIGFLALFAFSLTGCGGGHDETWWWWGGRTPAAPTGVLATFNSPATITWNPVDGAASYNIYYSTNPDFTTDTGTKISGVDGPPYTIPDGTLEDNTTYYFVVTAVSSAGRESEASLKVSAIHATYAQADLEGSWYVTLFWTGVGDPPFHPGWLRMRVTLDAEGNATINYYELSDGTTEIPPGALSFTIDDAGLVTQGGDFAGNDSDNVMSSNKRLIIGTNTRGTIEEIRIFRKADPTAVFSDADLANKTFAFHQLGSGSEVGWVRGEGSIGAAGEVTIDSIADSAGGGTIPPSLTGTLSINANGIVSSTGDSFFRGVMSPDKTLVIGTTRNAEDTAYQLLVIQISGATFTMGDLAGAYAFSSLFDGESALWQYGTLTVNSSGDTTYLTYLDSTGSSVLPAGQTLSMDAAGTITNAADATFHGTLSFNKDLIVATFTATLEESPIYGLSLSVR